jgi:hypothetical protein
MYAASLEVSTVLHEGFGMSMDLMVQAMKIKVETLCANWFFLSWRITPVISGSAGLVTSTSLTSVKLASVR